MAPGTTDLFSSGFETASLVASSGLLSSPWNLIAHLTAETHPNQNLFWKKLSNNGSDLTIIAFGTTLNHVQPDLVRSTDMRDNPFGFLCSAKNPNFSLNMSPASLFNDHSQMLDQLKSEIDLKKPVMVTGHGVGGSIASLFTLWLIEKMGSSDKCPLCITFGSPLIGDKCLQEAISQSSRWNSCFLHVASHRDPLVSSFISDDSYRPFGTFLLCSDRGSTCSENPDSILSLLKEMSTPDQGFHQFQGYGNIVENLTSQVICKDSDVPNIPQNPLQAGLTLQLQVLGFSNSQLSQNNLVKDLEGQEVLLTLNKRQRFIPHKKLYGMKIYMAQLEWYKKSGKRRGGYYDSHKVASTPAYPDSAMVVRVLNNYWKGKVEEVYKEPLKEGFAFCTQWLYAGTSYRRMVEPLDIAHYYREGGEDYINKGRSEHYKLLQKWQEEEQKKRLEEDKKMEPLNRKINVQAILTWDSCFWAHVEEAVLSFKTCKDASSNVLEKQEAMKRLEEFEEYVYGVLKNYTLSPDIFLEGSTYMCWWNDYIKFKGSSHRSSLANFMTNYVMYENGEYDFSKDITSLTSDSVKDTLGIVGKGIEYGSTHKNLESAIKDSSPLVEKIRPPTLKSDAETLIFPEFVEGLNSALMEELKSRLTTDDGDKILNLNGLTGMGKTTLALQLCADPQVRGWFEGNVTFVSVESNSESIGEHLGSEVRKKWKDRKGLLVLDNVESGSEDVVANCLRQLSSNSKILAISRVVLRGLGRPVAMTPLGEEDVITLLRHFVGSIGPASCNLPDDHIVRQVVKCCGGYPMAIKMIGHDLKGKQTDFWEQYLRDWSRQGHSIILDTRSKLLDHFHHSLQVSEEYKAISEFFMDLGLFPTHANIPVSALLDMWVQLYNHDEDGRDANEVVRRLTAMNLADRMVQTRDVVASNDEANGVDNQFLTQHNILRELANRYSREQAGEFERKRLIVEINGNDVHPECLLQQAQGGISAFLPFLNAAMQPRVAARILSITTDQNVTPHLWYIQAAEAQVLVLNLRTCEYRLPKFIKEMKNLKVLIVTNYGLRSTQFENFKRLGFLYNLERIRLERVTVPCVWKLKKLRKLSLYKCEVRKAFEASSTEFSKAMPNLVELRIEDSTDLVELPAGIWNIVSLKKISITKCCNFTELHQEIRKLRKLELLRISYCDKFEEMPESISELQNLTFLDISHCRMLRKLPDNIGQLQKLTNFYMPGCLNIDGLPSSIMSLTCLERVICDEYTFNQWEHVHHCIQFDLKIQTTLSMP